MPGRGRRLLLAMIVYGGVTAGAMACRDQWTAMALLFLSGVSMVTAFSTLNSLVQENAPDALKGRILSIYGLAFRGGLPLGALLAGAAGPSLRRAAGDRRLQRRRCRPGRGHAGLERARPGAVSACVAASRGHAP